MLPFGCIGILQRSMRLFQPSFELELVENCSLQHATALPCSAAACCWAAFVFPLHLQTLAYISYRAAAAVGLLDRQTHQVVLLLLPVWMPC
jgi:hypothetical protein